MRTLLPTRLLLDIAADVSTKKKNYDEARRIRASRGASHKRGGDANKCLFLTPIFVSLFALHIFFRSRLFSPEA